MFKHFKMGSEKYNPTINKMNFENFVVIIQVNDGSENHFQTAEQPLLKFKTGVSINNLFYYY